MLVREALAADVPALIDLMMIDHTCHRRGLGTELLRQVEASLGERHDEIRLESFAANRPADAFYRRNGWREVGRHLDDDTGAEKLVFRKRTGPTTRRQPPE